MGKQLPIKVEINLWQDTIRNPTDGRKLRISYLSADLANHPVGRFLLPVLSNHNKNKFEIWGLSCGSHDDWITDHIRQRVDHWIDLRFKSASESARIIADLELDVIIELVIFSRFTLKDSVLQTGTNTTKLSWLSRSNLFGLY